MKKFKNKLAINASGIGAKHLLKAFVEELKGFGYTVHSEHNDYFEGYIQVNQYGGNGVYALTSNSVHGYGDDVTHLTLPQEWDKALELASEVDTVIPEYIIATKDYNGYFIPGIVYKVLDSNYIYSVELTCNIKSGIREIGQSLHVDLNPNRGNWKLSSKEEYEKQAQSKFKEGDWCYLGKSHGEYLIKFKGVKEDTVSSDEYYFISSSISSDIAEKSDNLCGIDQIRLATNEEIKRILTKAAEIKYPIGTNYKSAVYNTPDGISNGSFRVEIDGYGIEILPLGKTINDVSRYVYYHGKWADIVKNPKPEMQLFGEFDVEYNIKDGEFKIGCQYVNIFKISELYTIFQMDTRLIGVEVETEGGNFTFHLNEIEDLLKFAKEVEEYEKRN